MGMLCGCAQNQPAEPVETTELVLQVEASDADIAHLESLYQGKAVVHGDTHSHTASSEFSDGKHSLAEWKEYMEQYGIDFATVVDHR